MSEKIKENSSTKDFIYGSILFVLVIALWYFSWQYIDNSVNSTECGLSDTEARGLFGDKFGAINALFSALAFAGIIFTIFLQKRELKLQREEMEETRGEFIKQNETLIQQKFENTFFQLINLFNSIVNTLDLRNKQSKVVTTLGRECFDVFFKRLRNHLRTIMYGGASANDNLEGASIAQTLEAYQILYNNEKSDMSHYFRTIYHIYKFIDTSEIKNKKQYTSIARAQLSSYEQVLLFYNCLHSNGLEKFKPLIEKYAVFKNLDYSLLINQDHLDEYDKSAYGK